MLIQRIELENIKSYKQVTVDFRRGTTAISGANGAGKTTLVEAIGYALFGYLPYKQEQFIREGEKNGSIIVHLIGGDDRPYIVERHFGTRSRWFVFDKEANSKVEQQADVQDKLHDLFGIDRGRPLDSLFRDALGVPQGTFTAIFLANGSDRKRTFDALLQVEDYKTAAEKLLLVQRHYKDQVQAQQSEIQRLEYETRDLDAWRIQLYKAQQEYEQQQQQDIEWSQQVITLREQLLALREQERELHALGKQHEHCTTMLANAQHLLHERYQQVEVAREAQRIVKTSVDDYQRYLQANETLANLRKDEQQRNSLLRQQADLRSDEARVAANEQQWLKRLQEVEQARYQVGILAPLVEQQDELEQRHFAYSQKQTRYKTILEQGTGLRKRVDRDKQKQAEIEHLIEEIVPLEPLAQCFDERNEHLHQLQAQFQERGSKQRQLQAKQEEVRQRQRSRDVAMEKWRKAEQQVQIIEEYRQEAEEMPQLEARRIALLGQENRVTGNIEGYTKWRTQSGGGQCPLLHEGCLNIRRRGVESLESYFDGLLHEEHTQLFAVQQEQQQVTERTNEIQKYAERFSNLTLYAERRDNYANELQRLDDEIARAEREIETLTHDLHELDQLTDQITEAKRLNQESKAAHERVRELPGLRRQLAHLDEQVTQGDEELTTLRAEIAHFKGVDTVLEQIKSSLATLNNPRLRCQTQQSIVAQEAEFQQHLQQEQERLATLTQQLQALKSLLSVYATLDSDIQQQEVIRLSSGSGYQNYLKHVEVAQHLPRREQEYQQQVATTDEAQRQADHADELHRQALAAFDPQHLLTVEGEITSLGNALAGLHQQMQHLQAQIVTLEERIVYAEARMLELEAVRAEQQTLDDLRVMIEQFRGYIKEAGPYVLKAMLADISAEANRIFGEIMGDRSAQLSWQNDYEILLRRQGVNRSFAQLSGGEQMSAALAVRLALLKKLSTLNLAFFDEPTQNMDELRRMNLAEQIRRVRGFDQLIVISHDDTFEQGLDSLVRLSKRGGETQLLSEEEIREQVHAYAS